MAASGALNLFKSPWDPELIAQCWLGVSRFDHFRERLGISRQVLAQRLKDLVAEQILVREQYQSGPNRYEYRLTEKGRDLLPVFVAMMEWSERWQPHHHAEKWRALYARFQEAQPRLGRPADEQDTPLTRREREVASWAPWE